MNTNKRILKWLYRKLTWCESNNIYKLIQEENIEIFKEENTSQKEEESKKNQIEDKVKREEPKVLCCLAIFEPEKRAKDVGQNRESESTWRGFWQYEVTTDQKQKERGDTHLQHGSVKQISVRRKANRHNYKPEYVRGWNQ